MPVLQEIIWDRKQLFIATIDYCYRQFFSLIFKCSSNFFIYITSFIGHKVAITVYFFSESISALGRPKLSILGVCFNTYLNLTVIFREYLSFPNITVKDAISSAYNFSFRYAGDDASKCTVAKVRSQKRTRRIPSCLKIHVEKKNVYRNLYRLLCSSTRVFRGKTSSWVSTLLRLGRTCMSDHESRPRAKSDLGWKTLC